MSYLRRLNKLAHPDPEGKAYKVIIVIFMKGLKTVWQKKNICVDRYYILYELQYEKSGVFSIDKSINKIYKMINNILII